MTNKKWKILGIQQIAIGGTSKEALSRLWVDTFGLTKKGSYQSKAENVDEDILEIGHGPHAIEIDIMQPIDPEGRPKVHLPPLNHIGLWVENLDACVADLKERGMRFTPGGIRKGAAGYNVCFIHPKGNEEFPLSAEGVLIELVEAPPEIVEALS